MCERESVCVSATHHSMESYICARASVCAHVSCVSEREIECARVCECVRLHCACPLVCVCVCVCVHDHIHKYARVSECASMRMHAGVYVSVFAHVCTFVNRVVARERTALNPG